MVKRYHSESGSLSVEVLFNAPDNRFLISRLALVEVHSSAARLVREGVLSEIDFRNLIGRLEDDVAAGFLKVAALSNQRLEGAATILGTHGLANTVRTLDAIHLATALALHRRSQLAAVVASDKRLLASATACGLAVLDVG